MTTPETVTEGAAVRAVRTMYEAFARGDLPAVLALLDPEITWIEPDGLAVAGTYTGRDAVVEEVFSYSAQNWDPFRVVPDEFLAVGDDVVVALGWYDATHRSTGKSFSARFAHVIRLRDGVVTSMEAIADTHPWREAET
ncbi:nuclear transport factor 2 family protein [Pseudonocardia sp. NPDC049154]|uniref:nuclear transport factor 2 family protein n=1 Tax=Pseudonocardia sp. NPDC049154 TaxID=3155501 RepID=UPI0033C9F554